MDSPHLGFIVAAYALAAVTILAMIGSIVWDYRRLSAELRALEERRGDRAGIDPERLGDGPDQPGFPCAQRANQPDHHTRMNHPGQRPSQPFGLLLGFELDHQACT